MLLQDLSYSFRRLVRVPAFTLTAVLTLALGIGANTAIFSTVNALLLRPYPFRNLERLMLVRASDPNRPNDDRSTPADYLDFRTQCRAFADVAAFRFRDFNLDNESGGSAIEGYLVTPNLFQMIGVKPLLGRNLADDDAQEGHNLVALISHNTWRERFASDSSVIGKAVRLNGRYTIIVGVMSAGFHYPLGAEIWMPLTFTPTERTDRQSHNLNLLGLLKEGVSRQQAEAELQAFSRQLQQQYPTTNLHRTATVLPLRQEQYTYTAPMFLILQVAAGFVLLLACANLVNLLLAQAVSRGREIAVRSALGADRFRLARLFASESLLLSLLAVAVAVSVSFATVAAIRNGMPSGMTKWIAGWSEIRLDASVLGFAISLAVVLALAIGLGSSLRASRMNVNALLRDSIRTSTGSRAQHRLLSALVITQVVLAVVLLTGAASTIRSFIALSKLYNGFDPEDVLTIEVRLPKQSYNDPARIASFYERALQQTQSLPQLVSAALASNTPASNVDNERVIFDIIGHNSVRTSEAPTADLQVVSPDFFSTLRVPLLHGRSFSASDGRNSPRVAIVNQTMARRNWPNSTALGQSLTLNGDNSNPVPVVGVVSDMKLNWYDPHPHPTVYLPYMQAPRDSLTLVTRVRPGSEQSAPNAITRLMRQLDPDVAVNEVHPLMSEISDSLAPIRIIGWLMLVFGGVALGLSTIGIYGMLAHRVARRTHEFGVRMALGATSEDLFRQIVGEALTLAGVGLALGLPVAYGMNLLASSLLFGLNGLNWTTLAAFTVGILLIAVFAALAPSRRAMRADPIVALRYE